MIWKLLIITLVICITAYTVIYHVREPPVLKEVKRRYATLREYIQANKDTVDKKFLILTKEILVSGFLRRMLPNKVIGYNVNKGYEIGVCIDGDPNDVFHVLIHELAHSVSTEYSHGSDFWKNFSDLKDLCIKCGVYTKLSGKKNVCGSYIQE